MIYGTPLAQARAAVILVHGRGASAQGMLPLAQELESARMAARGENDLAFLIPQAPGSIWYPYPFNAPLAQNEPQLSQSLDMLAGLVEQAAAAGIDAARLVLAGFSQGASLSLEFAARNPRRYGGVAGLSGSLIGPPGIARPASVALAGTPIFLGCSDTDPFIPKERVLESERVLRELGAEVTARLYPGKGHTVNEDELAFVAEMVRAL